MVEQTRPLFGSDAPRYGVFARVVLERGIDAPDGLTYAVPAAMEGLRVGERVTAPLGRGNKPAEGVVVEIVTDPAMDASKIKPISARHGGALGESVIALARWMSGYYACPIGMVLATMVPAAVKRKTGRVVRKYLTPTGHEPDGKLTASVASAWEAIRGIPGGEFPLEPKTLALRVGAANLGPINKLVRAGLLEEVEIEGVRTRFHEAMPRARSVAPELTKAQRSAIEAVAGTIGTFSPHLLFGVTGSGKTEVYLGVLERVLARGLGAIVLVPEISLTPQTAGRFLSRFGREGVAVLHSALTASQRHAEWRRIAEGKAAVVIGARSAVFAPFGSGGARALGLVVVDEEHDSSYKQDQLPRYHARDVALKRAQLEDCPVVLGSATPSLESWRNAKEGRFGLLELKDRVGGGVLPRVTIVDLEEERKNRTEDRHLLHALGPTLERAIRETLFPAGDVGDGGQVMLLLNRRGYASYLACAACEFKVMCHQCDATLVYHKRLREDGVAGGFVRCHHCLSETKLPRVCPDCGKKIVTLGFGTQRLEEELARKLPELREDQILRLDSDTMRSGADYFDSLEKFRTGAARVMLGTQMIAKGLDFPDVRLIGVVNADTAIHLPDFRAAERTFQLVAQVAGRAGRSERSGKGARVVIQTMCPKEPAIVFASGHDFAGFAEREMEIRGRAGLPPVTRMARIVCRDTNSGKAESHAEMIAGAIRSSEVASQLRVRGPAACPLSRVSGHFRFGIEITASSAGVIQRVLTELRVAGLAKSDAHTAVDVDPVALL